MESISFRFNIATMQHFWCLTDLVELRCFIGLLITLGVTHGKNEPLTEVWYSKSYRRPLFRAAMPLNRFKQLLRALAFDDRTTRDSRKQWDKFCLIRDFFSSVNEILDPAWWLMRRWHCFEVMYLLKFSWKINQASTVCWCMSSTTLITGTF